MKKYWSDGMGRLEIEMTLEQAESASHQGRCDDDVASLVEELRGQLDKLDKEKVKESLKEYGAWNEEELSDHEANLQRLVWIASGDMVEEARNEQRNC